MNSKRQNQTVGAILGRAVGRVVGGASLFTMSLYLFSSIFIQSPHPDTYTIRGFFFIYAIGAGMMLVYEMTRFFDWIDKN